MAEIEAVCYERSVRGSSALATIFKAEMKVKQARGCSSSHFQ